MYTSCTKPRDEFLARASRRRVRAKKELRKTSSKKKKRRVNRTVLFMEELRHLFAVRVHEKYSMMTSLSLLRVVNFRKGDIEL
jgi:hypothetical protein